MGILVITVDLDCCRCRAKITKVLDCLKEEFNIEKVEFEDKKEKKVVVVRGKFDPEKLRNKILCKAGKIVKEIIIVEVWPPKPPPKPCHPCIPDKCCGCEHCKPKPDKCCGCEHCCKPKCCVCEHCKPKPKPEKKPEKKPEEKPPPAKTQYKFVPYPYPLPNPGPWQCPPHQPCQCCEKPPPPPPPCSCSSHGSCVCGQTPPVCVWPPQPPVWPPPWAGCNVVADEGQCSVM